MLGRDSKFRQFKVREGCLTHSVFAADVQTVRSATTPSREAAKDCSPGRKPWVGCETCPSPERAKETAHRAATPQPLPTRQYSAGSSPAGTPSIPPPRGCAPRPGVVPALLRTEEAARRIRKSP